MILSRWLSRAPALMILVTLLALAGCGAAAVNSQGSSPTATPTSAPTSTPTVTPTLAPTDTPTPTLAPTSCGQRYSVSYYSMLPDSSYPQTNVYAQVQLPPQTRLFQDDASGHRYKFLCSAETTAAVLAFMTQHLTQLGWQQEALTAGRYCDRSGPAYPQQQCWKNGRYELFMGLNSNFDWALVYLDPAFLP